MTVKQAIKLSGQKLKSSSFIANYYLEAEILLANILHTNREFILAHPQKKLTNKQNQQFFGLVSRRLTGEPIAYLTGQKEFYGLDFKINKNVLVPRPETELIVDKALNLILKQTKKYGRAKSNKKIIVADIGTGSGCIIISLVKQLQKILPANILKNNFLFWASDISKPALRVARFNAQKHKLDKQINFSCGNLIQPLIKKIAKISNSKNKLAPNLVFLANLPYLTPGQIKNSPSVQLEPRLSLNGGADGLNHYRQLFKQIKTNGLIKAFNLFLLAEIDPEQKNSFKKLKQKYLPKALIKFNLDLADYPRLAKIIAVRENK